jgi:hypothetical protein
MIFENEVGVNANLAFPSNSVRSVDIPELDLVAVEILHAPVRRDLTKLFPIEEFSGCAEGLYCIRHSDGVERLPLANIKYCGATSAGELNNLPCVRARAARDTMNGECGSPMVAWTTGGVMIMGIHAIGGFDRHVYAVRMLRKHVNAICKHFEFSEVSTGAPALKVGEYEQKVGPLHPHAHVSFKDGTALVVGSDPGFRAKPQSKVRRTMLADSMEKRGFFSDNAAPDLRAWQPYALGLDDLLHTNRAVNINILHECAQGYVDDVLSGLPSGWEEMVHFVDQETAINGAEGVAYIDPLNKKTSAGAPINRQKRHFMREIDGKWDVTEEIQKDVNRIQEVYDRGERATPLFMAHLKDQAIPKKKVEAHKVRVFQGGPMAWVIVVRMHLLWFIRLAQNYRLLFEAGPGTVAQSREWGLIYAFLTQFGTDRVVAGDFGKFDKKMGTVFILYAYWIIIQIGKAGGMSDEDLRIIWCIAEDTAFAFTNYNGDLLQFLGSNPSGHPLTVTVNSLVNSLYMRYTYRIRNPAAEVKTFKKNVALYTYGDDNIMGVSRLIDWFHHTAIRDVMASIGVEYTMADKETASVPFIDIKDATFLKRSWRYDAQLGTYVAPLAHESIIGMLCVGIVSKNLTPQAHAVIVMETALREYFYYGREVFEEKRIMFNDIVAELGLEDYMPYHGFPTWDVCVDTFERSSARTDKVLASRL